jgi:hypothetical protein
LTSCEGVKFLNVVNEPNKSTFFIVENLTDDYLYKTQLKNLNISESYEFSIIEMKVNSKIAIPITSLSTLMFGNKIITPKLNINKLYITQGADTIKFDTKQERVDALKRNDFKTKDFSFFTKRKNNTIIVK